MSARIAKSQRRTLRINATTKTRPQRKKTGLHRSRVSSHQHVAVPCVCVNAPSSLLHPLFIPSKLNIPGNQDALNFSEFKVLRWKMSTKGGGPHPETMVMHVKDWENDVMSLQRHFSREQFPAALHVEPVPAIRPEERFSPVREPACEARTSSSEPFPRILPLWVRFGEGSTCQADKHGGVWESW